MAETTIEWTKGPNGEKGFTFNPWEGCQKVGPGCDHCYAETRNARFAGGTAINWGPGAPRRRTSDANWRMPLKWNREAERTGVRPRVFCASLADVFDNAVDPAWRADLFKLIADTQNLNWLLLTKRVGNVMKMANEVADMPRLGSHTGHLIAHQWRNGSPPKNVWLGATVVNQEEADRDIPKLLAVPAAKRFLSIEPMLGTIDLGLCDCDKGSVAGPGGAGGVTCPKCGGTGGRTLDWVIIGGESGPGARPMSPDWARSIRDQCAAAGVPFLFKQWGEWGPDWEGAETCGSCGGSKFDFINSYGECGRCGVDSWVAAEKPLDSPRRVGKKTAGRLLDGRTHDGFPATQDAKEAGVRRLYP